MKSLQPNTDDIDDVTQERRRSPYMGGQDPGIELYFRSVSAYFSVRKKEDRVLTPEEEIEFIKRIRAGDAEARDEFIMRNVRLVVKIAKDYVHRGVSLLDLINVGNIGILKAIERFDPERFGTKFSTYASWWIKQGIKLHIAESGHIRVPNHTNDKMNRSRRIEAELEQELERAPSDEELAAALNTSVSWVKEYRAFAQPVSLQLVLNEDVSQLFTVGDCVVDESELSPCEAAERDEDHQYILRLVKNKLTMRELDIIYLRFGFVGGESRTLDEVGREYRLTRERVRQIQEKALKKLRDHMYRRQKREGVA